MERRKSPMATLLCLAALCLMTLGHTTSAQHLENDLQSLLNDINVNNHAANKIDSSDDDFEVELFYPPEGASTSIDGAHGTAPLPASAIHKQEKSVKRLWGIPDTETSIGRLFIYPIPSDAFQGDVAEYKFKRLPSWLYYNTHLGTLEGVPRAADRGHHYVTVKAIGKDGTIAKDVFSIAVEEVSGRSLSHSLGCHPKDDLSILSVVLNTHLPTMDAKSTVRLVKSVNKFFKVKGASVSLVTAPHDFDPLSDDSAIMAGPGSARLNGDNAQQSMSQLQWVVGCNGDISKHLHSLVDHIEATARIGELQRWIDIPVIGWHVTQVNSKSKRVRRDADYSGDDYEYNNYDYNNYEYNEYIYGDDEDTGITIEDYGEPETRVIPSLRTPVFGEASATPGYPDKPVDYSPTLRVVPMSTPVYTRPKPTPIIDPSPTMVDERVHATDVPEIEGSILTQPTTRVESTTPLTSTSTTPITSTDIPYPTKTMDKEDYPTRVVTDNKGNQPPRSVNRIRKLYWIAGHVYRFKIPNDTFYDKEDGNTSKLGLRFLSEKGNALLPNSFIKFNPTTQEIIALPLEDDIGRETYILEAIDSEGLILEDYITIFVDQAKESRNYNHQFTATFKIEKKYEFGLLYKIDWQIKAVEKIAQLYGDETTDNINVRYISMNPVKLTWTNITLTNVSSSDCPTEEIQALSDVVMEEDSHDPTQAFKQILRPQFHLKHVHLHLKQACDVPVRPPSGGDVYEPPVEKINPDSINNRPIFMNDVDFLEGHQGQLYRYQIPSDTCYDSEDGNSRNLHMRLLLKNMNEPPTDFWLQFDTANQEFFGIPLAGDVGDKNLFLECKDSEGLTIRDALIFRVNATSNKIPLVEFSMKIDIDYQTFMNNPYLKSSLIEKIGAAFGDDNITNIVVDSIRQGSVIISWHNQSITHLSSGLCPSDEIEILTNLMMDDNGNLLPSFVKSFGPGFSVIEGSVKPTGSCLGEDTPTHTVEPPHLKEEEEHLGASVEEDENNYLLNFIIPAVIIATMLFLAALIACCLYRRRRYGKMTMADDRTFVSKGIPIIFAEELDDRPDPAKSPVIMKDEKPPLPPPEYQRGGSPAASTPPSRRPNSTGAPDDAPSYQPPPPFTATNGGASRHPRPNMPPTYRKPPTYVPP